MCSQQAQSSGSRKWFRLHQHRIRVRTGPLAIVFLSICMLLRISDHRLLNNGNLKQKWLIKHVNMEWTGLQFREWLLPFGEWRTKVLKFSTRTRFTESLADSILPPFSAFPVNRSGQDSETAVLIRPRSFRGFLIRLLIRWTMTGSALCGQWLYRCWIFKYPETKNRTERRQALSVRSAAVHIKMQPPVDAGGLYFAQSAWIQ